MCWISSTTNYNLISGHLNNWLTIIFILFCVSFFDSKCLKYKQKKTSTVPLILFFMNLKYIVKKNKKWFWQHIGQIQVLISNEQKILWIKQIKRSEKKVATVNFLNNLDINIWEGCENQRIKFIPTCKSSSNWEWCWTFLECWLLLGGGKRARKHRNTRGRKGTERTEKGEQQKNSKY